MSTPYHQRLQQFLETPDPAREEMEGGATPYHQRLASELGINVGGDDRGFFHRAGDAIKDFSTGVTKAGSLENLAAGVISTGLLEAGAALLDIPGLFTDKPVITDYGADFLRRASEGLLTIAEEYALNIGMTPEEIAAVQGFGRFAGYFVPISASYKAASAVLRSGKKLSTVIKHGDLVTDFASGVVFGGLFTEGDFRDRGRAIIEESAMFGIARVAIMGVSFPYKAYRSRTILQKNNHEEVNSLLERMMRGETITDADQQTLSSVLDLLNKENYILSSPAAQDILERSGRQSAIVQAIRDVAESRGSMGIIKDAGKDFYDTKKLVTEFQQEFPGLKFDVIGRNVRSHRTEVSRIDFEATDISLETYKDLLEISLRRNKDGKWQLEAPGDSKPIGGQVFDDWQEARAFAMEDLGFAVKKEVKAQVPVEAKQYDIYFGVKGLNNKQRAQLANGSEYFTGQKIWKNGVEYEYMGPSSQKGFLKVSTGDGRTTKIKNQDITPLPYARELDTTPQFDELYYDFVNYAQRMSRQMLEHRQGMLETDIISGVRNGTFTLNENSRRAFDKSGAIINPEELGLSHPRAAIFDADFLESTPILQGQHNLSFSQAAREVEQRGAFAYFSPDGDVTVIVRGELTDAAIERQLRRAGLPVEGATIARVSPDPQIPDNVYQIAPAAKQISQEGLENVHLLEPPEIIRIEDMFEAWAKERGIIAADEDAVFKYLLPNQVGPEAEMIRPGLSTMINENAASAAITRSAKHPGKHQMTFFDEQGMPVGDIVDSRKMLDDVVESLGLVPDQVVRPGGTPADFEAMRAHFADRLRQALWKEVPEADRRVFEKIRDELHMMMEREELPLEVMAHMKGFTARRMEDGRYHFREINSGAEIVLGNEQVAREALRNIVRSEGNPFSGLLPDMSNGMAGITGGFPKTDGEFTFGDKITSKEFLENIPYAGFRNVRDWLIDIEQQTGLELFSKGFDRIDTGLSKMRNRYEPWAKEIENTWKGISKKEKEQIVDFWVSIEGQNIPLARAVSMAKEAGLSNKQIVAFQRARTMFDRWHQMSDLEPSRYISTYYSRIRPYAEENGRVDILKIFEKDGRVPPEFEFWADMQRTGEMPIFEKDPELVMHKYIRGLLFKQEVKPHWDSVARLVGTKKNPGLKIRDLPMDQQAQILKNAAPGTTPDDHVLPKPVRDVLQEYLTITRGSPGTSLETLRRFNIKLFNMLGIQGDSRVIEEYLNTAISSMYGSAMGLRMSLVSRNAVQNLWTLYPRLGAARGGDSLRRAMTLEGFQEAVESGAIRLTEAGIPYGDIIFEDLASRTLRGQKGLTSIAVASAMRLGLRLGYVSRKTAEKFLIPYASGDHMNRAWAYHWQKMHTADLLDKFEARKIGWDKFIEDGLPFYSRTVKERFADLYKYEGREAALRYAGKVGADEANFIYGVGAQPAWMQKPFGRFVGMFGTWPLWAIELYTRRMKYGTMAQRAAFTARNLALVGAFSNMVLQSGLDLWSWIAPGSSFNWAGGPFVDHAINLKRVVDAPMDQKVDAFGRFTAGVGRLALPGQVFLTDVQRALELERPDHQALSLLLGRPSDVDHWSMSWLFDPDMTGLEMDTSDPTLWENPQKSMPSIQLPPPPEAPMTEIGAPMQAPTQPAPDLDLLMRMGGQ